MLVSFRISSGMGKAQMFAATVCKSAMLYAARSVPANPDSPHWSLAGSGLPLQATSADAPVPIQLDGADFIEPEDPRDTDGLDAGTWLATEYPHQLAIDFAALPVLPGMPEPCAGVPQNGFCPRQG